MIRFKFTDNLAQCHIGHQIVFSKQLRKPADLFKRDLEKLGFYDTVIKALPNLVPADQVSTYVQKVKELEDVFTMEINDKNYPDSD